MTHISETVVELQTDEPVISTRTLNSSEISVIVPVRNNTAGLKRLMLSASFGLRLQVRELIIVDDDSNPQIDLSKFGPVPKLPLRVIRTEGVGPAGARNRGACLAEGDWLLFVDSDCLFTETLVTEYKHSMNGAVGYAGHVKATGQGLLSKYYDSQRVLIPFGIDEGRPRHIITANALIWRRAFELIGGFDEAFYLAAGEDVDLGLRLNQVGGLQYVPKATILHDYGGLFKFCERFFRYGRANAMLERKHFVSFRPQKQSIRDPRLINYIFAFTQYLITLLGYHFERRNT